VTIFSASPVLIALNHPDPAIRLERITALAGLVEHFSIELEFEGDAFTGLVDRLAPLRAEMAVA
jgi:hypothetical protein